MPIKKERDNGKGITYKLKFIDSFRFMSSSLSNLIDNLSERVHSDKYTDCKSCLMLITYVDYRHAKKVLKEFKINNLGGCHNLSVQSDTLLLAQVLQNFQKKCIEIYELDPAQFLSAP